MKIVNEAIRVDFPPEGGNTPRLIAWRDQVYSVLHLQEEWKVCSKWWTQEVERHYMLLQTDQFMMEVYRQADDWKLYRLY
ncbi:MAG: hypothetical protein KDD67_03180 [Ignavibacteriae bacterium]|nr:hypothetical protein [Ignavibacteriota bacterium]MCB9217166.1 hypothetical protein [Ignavibacteria bacterium]